MRNYIYLFCLLSITLFGCTKSFDDSLYDTQTLNGSFNTTTDVLDLIQGAYGILQNTELYKNELVKVTVLAADDMGSTTGDKIIANKIYDATTVSFSAIYGAYYNNINNYNFILEKLPLIKPVSGADSNLKVREEGNVRFFRALCYFDLVRLFGDVPLRMETTTSKTNFYIQRSPLDSVYALILSDLSSASNLLAYKSSPDGINLTNKGAALSLLALANLTYANNLERRGKDAKAYYKMADSCATIVIKSGGYSLIPNFADLWNVDNESSAYGSEVIFGIRFTRDRIVAGNNSQGSSLPMRYLPPTMGGVTGNKTRAAVGGLGTGSGSYRIQSWFYDYYTSGDYKNDYRGSFTFLTSWNITPTSGTKYVSYPSIASNSNDSLPSQFTFINKYKDPKGIDDANHENDFFVMRLAEVYLIRAEAQNEYYGSPSASPNALSDINQLRARARKANITTPRSTPLDVPAGLSQNDFRKKIFDERGIEFIGEGKRWYDLVRMKGPDGTGTMYEYQFKTYLPSLPQGLPIYNKTTKTWSAGRVDPLCIVPYNSKYLLFPIPQNQRDLNKQLTQNNGW